MTDRDPLPDDRTPLQCLVRPPQVYRHYKGSHYSVVAVSRHSETLEWMVTYRLVEKGLKSGDPTHFWTRPLAMFCGTLGDGTARFERRR